MLEKDEICCVLRQPSSTPILMKSYFRITDSEKWKTLLN